MLYLKPVTFEAIRHWGVDYQKKSRNLELIPDEAELLGIYRNEELIGYFATLCFTNGVVEINQGYLKPEARHKSYNKIALKLLEDAVKKAGYKEILLGTNRAVGSYQRFMRECGFNLSRAIFSKKV